MALHTIFLHGLDSSGNGTKGRYFATRFPAIVRPDFHGPLNHRLEQLTRLCVGNDALCLIGSSYGGLMACCFAIAHRTRVKRLILLAPALNYENYRAPETRLTCPTTLIIGEHDTVTPPRLVVPLAEASCTNLTVHRVDDDHLLHRSFPALDWHNLLRS